MRAEDIAVVGMACVFPGAPDLTAYWHNLVGAVDAITELPADRWPGSRGVDLPPDHDAHISCHRGGFIRTPYLFDPARYRVMPNVARHGDPDQFILLDVVAAALEDAGIGPDDSRRQRTDLIVGRGGYTSNKMMEVFLRADGFERLLGFLARRLPALTPDDLESLATDMRASLPEYDVDGLASSIPNLVASRAANRLDLRGAAFIVDAACASSLLAVESAVQRLRDGRSDVVVAAGINFTQIPSFWYLFTRILAMSPSGHIRPFDRRADGMLIGEGAGAVVLQRAEDARRRGECAYALVRGVGSASDGRSAGVLSPSSEGQRLALVQAYRDADVEPDTIGFLEAHGTGTPAGDLVEIETIRDFFGPAEATHAHRVMGSVKSMIGHTMPAAGVASLIKAALTLSNKILPPSLHCEEPHPALADTAFYVSRETRPWLHPPDQPRRAGVNAFGFGGINVHVVLEEVCPPRRRSTVSGTVGDAVEETVEETALRARPVRTGVDRPSELLSFASGDRATLAARLEQVARFVREDEVPFTLEDLAWTLAGEADAEAACRLALVATSLEGLDDRLEALARRLEKGPLETLEAEGLFYGETGACSVGHTAAVFPGIAFPGLVGAFPRHLLINCIHHPIAREIFDHIEARDGHPEDPLPSSFLLVPPAHLPLEERARLQARFGPPSVASGADGAPSEIRPDERSLCHMGMLANNWASWRILEDLRVPVDMVCGQSLGDLSAVLAAGMVDFEESIPRFWEAFHLELPYEGMGLIAMVGVSEERILPFLADHPEVSIGLHLSPTTMVIGGPETDVRALCRRLREEGMLAQTLPFPAIHTPRLRHMQHEFERAFGGMARLKKARIPVYSGAIAAPLPGDPEAAEAILRSNISSAVRFWQTIHRMYDDGARFLLQIGSGTLAANSRSVLDRDDAVCLAMDVAHRDPVTQLQILCAQLFAHGVVFDSSGLFPAREPQTLPLDEVRPAPRPPPAAVPLTLYWPPMHDAGESTGGKRGSEAPPPTPQGRLPAEPAPVLPFLGRITEHEPGKRIRVETTITLGEHRYLEDHAFGNAVGHKPLAECFPLLPLTMTLELLAEVAACLAPGLGLVAFEDVQAHRWIAFEEVDKLDVRTEGRVERSDGEGVVVRAEVFVDREIAASARVVFARCYRETLSFRFSELVNPRPFPVEAADLYASRFLFHGPRFCCISAVGPRDEKGMTGELTVLDSSDFFASTSRPQLLTDPVVLDGAGQLVGAFFHGMEGYVLPVAVEGIEFYRPSPPPGTRVPIRIEFTDIDLPAQRTSALLEVQDGQGRVWFRVKGWQDRVFRWSTAMLRNVRDPEHHPLAVPLDHPALSLDGVAVHVSNDVLRDIDPDWLARNYLNAREWGAYRASSGVGRRRRDWLLGRVAAKDAVRLYLARRRGEERMLHPVLVTLGSDEAGAVRVLDVQGSEERVFVSLGHGEAGAVAAASDHPVGIDAEPARAAARLDASDFATTLERERLSALGGAEDEAVRLTRLWCAKEAAAKALGLGLGGRPRAWEALEVAGDGHFTIHHHESGRQVDVHSVLCGDVVVALAAGPEAATGRRPRTSGET